MHRQFDDVSQDILHMYLSTVSQALEKLFGAEAMA